MNQKAITTSENLKAAVYGANDGIITTFAVVAGVSGAKLATSVILILGVSNIVADGISMGLSDYIGSRSQQKYLNSQDVNNSHSKHPVWHTSALTFLAFIFAGLLPLSPYFLSYLNLNFPNLFLSSIISSGLALFTVGSLRTLISKGSWLLNGLEMLGVGALAATTAYALGFFVELAISTGL